MDTTVDRTRRRFSVVGLALVFAVLFTLAGSLSAPAGAAPVCNGTTCTETFAFTGAAQNWTVPAGVTSATFEAFGAQGGHVDADTGGLGGEAKMTGSVSAGQVIEIVVGGAGGVPVGGFNGGGAGGAGGAGPSIPDSGFSGAGGGGASDVRIGSCAALLSCGLADRVLVAGGGGGAVSNAFGDDSLKGGAGGNPAGGDGTTFGTAADGGAGTGGSQVAAGTGGAAANNDGCNGAGPTAGHDGAPVDNGAGGNGAPTSINTGGNGGGGGGGGYFGGGGGGGSSCFGWSGGGGGGSSFGPAGTTFNTGVQSGDGQVTVTYTLATPQSKDDCKNGGWKNLVDGNGNPFKNQGDCVSYVATKGKNKASG
jgi:Glycine rich protein